MVLFFQGKNGLRVYSNLHRVFGAMFLSHLPFRECKHEKLLLQCCKFYFLFLPMFFQDMFSDLLTFLFFLRFLSIMISLIINFSSAFGVIAYHLYPWIKSNQLIYIVISFTVPYRNINIQVYKYSSLLPTIII